MLPEKSQAVQELLDESQYFKQQLFNEVRRTIMLDYFASRENFLEVGEQYANHMNTNLKEWAKFVQFYSDLNNARQAKDEEYKREQFIGEELDWKMLADNLTLFGSQLGDLKDMQGFDPNSSFQMDQSIVVDNDGGGGPADGVPFHVDDAGAPGYKPPPFVLPGDGNQQRAGTIASARDDYQSQSQPLQQEQIQPRRGSLTLT